ncbi:phosphate ABC transporter substrate-binding protein [Sphingomonas ginkgonis]|uniref:Phosphate ABC transporter substrate-binding protein n=1 Tax=Sphingomonas ginkgonis TaxID=2315330 RepID=A0A429V8H5_9SPHN|nr:substrate-binding domain-containing protein [Sphingomonas ginkgonis]RST30192.1 phosphate ABC transporter substrate-binding protein [Sphingomonas ginkgonis]
MKKMLAALPLVALVAACGSNGGGTQAGGDIKVVGSSTVYPFTTAAAEAFQRANAGARVTVESTGTGAGMKLFCAGVGANFPDIEDASRAMKKSEYDECAKNGAKNVIEVPIGIDGLTIIESKGGQLQNLTQKDIYAALAANPYGKGPNKAQTWKDVNPALPAIKIRVLGPPPTSGTRDSLADLYLTKGCESDPAMVALKKSDEAKHKDLCTKVREDGAYVEAGENDNLLVQKVAGEPGTLGVLGYSYLEQNADKIQPVQIAGVVPTEATIANLSYPGARKLFLYVKGEHMQAKLALKQFVAFYATQWGKGGPLEKKGLVPFGGADASAASAQAAAMKPLDPAGLK